MLNATNNINEAWLSPSRQLEARITMNGEVYDNSSITSFSFDSGSISGESFQIGSAYMNQVQIVFPSVISTVVKDQELTIEVGILVDDVYHYTKLGKFIISEFDRNQNDKTTTVTAVDQMILLEGPYVSKITYPARIRDVALEIANLAGVEIDQPSFSTLPTTTIKKPEGYTYRQAIGLIAQFEGGFTNFNRDGKLQVRRLAPTAFTITPDNYLLKGFTKNETTYRPNGIVVRTGDEESDVLRVGSNSGNIIELENKVMTQTLLNTIWNRVKDISYFPYEVKWQGNPNLEAGDWFYIVDREGNRYSVPNLSFSFNYNGGMSAESKAITTSNSEVTYRYRGSLKQQIEEIKGVLEGANGWNGNYYDSETEPPNPKIGDLWFKKNGADNEIWIYRLVDGVAKWELEISSAPNQELLDAIQEAIDASNAAKQAGEEAKEAGERAEQLGNEAKQAGEEAKQAGEEAKAEAELAKQAGEEAKAAGQRAESLAGQAKAESATAIINANTAVNKANQAVEDAGFSKTQAQDAKQLADEAKQDALNAVSQSATAKQIAETASSAASCAVTTANQAKQDALNAIGQAGTAVTDAKAALDAYNNLDVGARNWLLNSNREFTDTTVGVWWSQVLSPVLLETMNAKNGDEITFSVYLKVPQTALNGVASRINFYRSDGTYITKSGNIIYPNNEGLSSVTFKIPDDSFYRINVGIQRQGADGTGANYVVQRKEEMLTKGNVILDWTPAPEDVQVQISNINGELSQKVSQTTFNTLQGTVSNQGTQINQNKSDIALKANKSTVDTLTGRVSTAEGQITTQAGQIAQRLTSAQVESLVNGKGYATQTSVNSQVSTINGKLNEHTSQLQTVAATVDNITAGNPNLLIRKGEVIDSWFNVDGIAVGVSPSLTQARSTGWIRVTSGESVTFSQIVSDASADNYFRYIFQDWNGNLVQRSANNSEAFTVTVPQYASHLRVSYQRNNKVKVENGNKATAWIPAVDDVASDIDLTTKTNAINQRITDTENSITAVVNTTTTQGGKISSLESKLTLAEGAITTTNSKVTSNTTQIGTLKTNYSSLQSTVSNIETEIGDLDFSDLNLMPFSDYSDNLAQWSTSNTNLSMVGDYLNIQFVNPTSKDTRAMINNVLATVSVGESFSISFTGYALTNGRKISIGSYFDNETVTLSDTPTTYYINNIKMVTNSPSVSIMALSGTTYAIRIKDIMVVKGVKAKPHQLALSDYTKITQFSDFKQDVNGFKQTVSSTYAKQTALNTVEQTVNSTTQTIASMQTDLNGKATVTALNSVKDTVDSHTQTITSHNGRITTAQQTADGAKTTATDAQGRVSSVEQKVSGLQTTVADKADKSQITQLSGQISSVVSDVSKKITDESFFTSSTSNSNSGKWTLFAQTKLSTKYADVQCGFDLIGRGTGNSFVYSAELFIRHKQQDDIGGSTLVEIALSNASVSAITADDFKAVVVQNSTTSVTVNYYMRINNTYLQFKISPFNKIAQGDSVLNFYDNQAFLESLPSGTTFTATERGVMAGLSGAKSQITQLSDQIDLRVTKAGLIGEINVRAGKTIIRQSDNVLMVTPTTTYIQDATIKNAHIADLAVTNAKIGNLAVNEGKIANAAITTLKVADAAISNAKIANLAVDGAKIASLAVDTGHIKDLAVSNAKIANLAVSNAKIADAAITSAKIGDAAIVNAKIANGAIDNAKIQDATISSAKISSIDANKISANSLSVITANTGDLNVNGWLTIANANNGIRANYDYGDTIDGAYNPRWFVGEYEFGYRYQKYLADVYNLTGNNERGSFRNYAETFVGGDYFKMRQYDNKTNMGLRGRVDIVGGKIEINDSWHDGTETGIHLYGDGRSWFEGMAYFGNGIEVRGGGGLQGVRTGRINAPADFSTLTINQDRALSDIVLAEQNIYFNETRTIAADFRIGRDGSTINGGRVVASNAIYNRTYSSAANMIITPDGVLGRSTSALKYKDDVHTANDVMSKAKKVIQLQPKSWLDKGELADGIANKRHYGFIADEFDALGLSEVVIYGDKGQVESLAYDRISMYHNVILKEHESEIQSMKYGNFERDVELQKLKFEIQRLNMEIESLRQSA